MSSALNNEPIDRVKRTAKRLGKRSAWFWARLVLCCGMVFGLGAVGSLAAWQDSSTTTSGNLSAGTIDLTLRQGSSGADGAVGIGVNFSFSDLAGTGLVPNGTAIAKQLTPKNSGSIKFGYQIAVSGSGTLATDSTGLNIKILPSATCTPSMVGNTGALYSGKIGGAATAARTLTANATDPLCVLAWLDAATANSLQGQSGTVQLTFTATQVA
ncbi:SipW-dependent-type signal peptide-containing protein [Psychromicrobium sp. YIM B11713]|uniref:SipW-dependent-type signal peptide-containing protein n=1 Tax=Psychromicrobium sp. YIM B11713 TaxID=3145233 RepID=UPI00374E9B96